MSQFATDGAILVTGAAGLIGNVVRHQLEAEGAAVIPIDRVGRTEEGSEIVVCDVNDIHGLHALAAKHRIAGIVHCGALSGPMLARDNPYAMVQVNIVGTANILEVARVHGDVRVVYCSSTSVYGQTRGPEPINEDVALFPSSVYGASKVAGEQLVSSYAKQCDVDGTSLRLCWVYGPRRTTDCVIRTMIENARAGVPTHLSYGGGLYRQYIHVDDAARALIAALWRRNLPRRTYSVTGGTNLTLDEIAAIVRGIYPGAEITLAPGPDPDDGVQSRFDLSAVERDIGFRPSLTFEHGVRSYARWLEARNAHHKAA
jgi:UDP-glucuronate 4-epimerase